MLQRERERERGCKKKALLQTEYGHSNRFLTEAHFEQMILHNLDPIQEWSGDHVS